MSESYNYEPPTDGSDEIPITLDKEPFQMTRRNTMLFTHIGEAALYDHVFFSKGETEDGWRGAYLWKNHPSYEQLVDFMVNHAYPLRLNNVEAAQCDQDAYWSSQLSDLDKGIPEDWTADEA